MTQKNFIQRTTQTVSFKLVVIAILALLLLIPAGMVKSLVRERQRRNLEVVKELTDVLGKDQTVTGPVISVPYRTYFKDEKGNEKERWHYKHFLPEKLKITGKVNPEIRYRGIYEVIAYSTKLQMEGNFNQLTFKDKFVSPEDIFWEDAVIIMGISDMRGIEENIHLDWNGETYKFKPGLPTKDLIKRGVNTPVVIQGDSSYSFSMKLHMSGSETLQFIPVGSQTVVNLSSDWETPSFSGNYLPDDRKVTKEGFQAEWQILELNRTYPQSWSDREYSVEESAFGVDLLFPVDIYQKNMRSVKYALLFIALTFVVFFFAEYLNKKRIHPIHYLLVGSGIVIFYSLLLSLSEHLSFPLSYAISAVAIIAMITSFLHGLLKNKKATLTVASILTLLYVFLYIILRSFDYSLLLGNIGLFIILASIMYFSRKIDWNKNREEELEEQ